MRQGADWIESLWRHGLIRATDAEVLASAAAVGNLAWASPSWPKPPSGGWRPGFRSWFRHLFPLVVVMLGMVVFILCRGLFRAAGAAHRRLTDHDGSTVRKGEMARALRSRTGLGRPQFAPGGRAAARCSPKWRWPRCS